MNKLFIILFLSVFLFGQETSSSITWADVEQYGQEKVTSAVNPASSYVEGQAESFVSKNLSGLTSQAQAIADGMGALESINISDFSLESLSNMDLSKLDVNSLNALSNIGGLGDLSSVDFSQLDVKSLGSLGNLAGINGMENLSYLEAFENFDVGSFDFGSLSNLGDFDFDFSAIGSLDSISSLTDMLGLGGSAKGSLQNLIALESQNVTQDTGQILYHTMQAKMYQDFLMEWKEINFIQEQKANFLLKY